MFGNSMFVVFKVRYFGVHSKTTKYLIFFQTDTKKAPYIDEIVPGIYLAGGGCGYAAKSCDEIGRIASKLVTQNQWTSELPQTDFKIKWKSTKSTT